MAADQFYFLAAAAAAATAVAHFFPGATQNLSPQGEVFQFHPPESDPQGGYNSVSSLPNHDYIPVDGRYFISTIVRLLSVL